VVDKFMAPVFATLTPALAERERRDRERNAKAAKVLADVDANDGDVGLKPLRMGTTKFEGQKARDAKAKRATGGPAPREARERVGLGRAVSRRSTPAMRRGPSESQQTMSSPRGRSRGEGLHANERKANAPIAGTETLRFHTIRAPDGSVVTMTRRGAQDSRPSRAAEREKRTMRRLEREHNRRAKSATRDGSSFTSEKQIRDAFEDDVAEAQSPLAQRGMETIVAAELAAWRSGLPTEIKKASATTGGQGATGRGAQGEETRCGLGALRVAACRRPKVGAQSDRRCRRVVGTQVDRRRRRRARRRRKSERKASSGSPPPITIMPDAVERLPLAKRRRQQLMTMHIAGQREAGRRATQDGDARREKGVQAAAAGAAHREHARRRRRRAHCHAGGGQLARHRRSHVHALPGVALGQRGGGRRARVPPRPVLPLRRVPGAAGQAVFQARNTQFVQEVPR
jgi:hypothetical protein